MTGGIRVARQRVGRARRVMTHQMDSAATAAAITATAAAMTTTPVLM
jgi:hypothetical protein